MLGRILSIIGFFRKNFDPKLRMEKLITTSYHSRHHVTLDHREHYSKGHPDPRPGNGFLTFSVTLWDGVNVRCSAPFGRELKESGEFFRKMRKLNYDRLQELKQPRIQKDIADG